MSGLRRVRFAWRRRRWKYCAGVVQLHTCMLSPAHSSRNRSRWRAGMLGALAFEAVREQQHDAAHRAPLRLPAGHVVVDDDLRAVGEVSELRLPHHQGARPAQGETVLEAEDRVLGQRAVVDGELDLRRRHVGQGRVGQGQPGLGVPPDQVALGEGAAGAVLAAQAHGNAVHEEGAEGQGLGECPVHRPVLLPGARSSRPGSSSAWDGCGSPGGTVVILPRDLAQDRPRRAPGSSRPRLAALAAAPAAAAPSPWDARPPAGPSFSARAELLRGSAPPAPAVVTPSARHLSA